MSSVARAPARGIRHPPKIHPPPVLERKSKFIGQVLRGKLDVREIEDIGETPLSYGEIKAMAAGDPLLLDKAQVDADLNLLRRLARAHDRSQDRLRWQVVSMADQKTRTENEVERLDAVLPQRQPTTADAFTTTIGAATFDKRADAGRAPQQRLAALTRDLGYQRDATVPTGRLGGLPVEATATRRSTGMDVTMRCTDVPHTSVDLGVESIADDTKAVGLVTRLENRINALDHRRDELQSEANRLTVEIDRAQRRIGTEFPQAGDLSATKLRAAEVEARLTEAARPRTAESTADHADNSIAADYSAGTDLAGDIGPNLSVNDDWNAP